MNKRRSFLKLTALSSAALLGGSACQAVPNIDIPKSVLKGPMVISTWDHGILANKAAMDILNQGGSALDAVEAAVRVVESDPEVLTVGVGGFPDREGKITLDACIMDYRSQCGSVAFLQNIENPISVARRVMEKTPHVMLAGKGAYQFARAEGFPHKDLNTSGSKAAYAEWLKKSKYQPIINIENHDTIGLLAMDAAGNLAGACTTSGMSFKMHGRVGDSPLIGAGLFLDNEVGAATATGVGEAIIRVAGSAMVVEAMRYGKTPQEACEEVVQRIIDKHPNIKDLQAGFIAMDKNGAVGAYSIYDGFSYALAHGKENKLIESIHRYKLKE